MAEQGKPTAYPPAAAHRSRSDVETPASGSAQRALAPAEAKFRRLFDSNIAGIIVADVHGRITRANDFSLRLLGYTPDDLPLRRDTMTPPEWCALDQTKQMEV